MPHRSKSKLVKDSFKIAIVGESGVGKSSLLSQFVHGNFSTDFVSTIGIDFGSKTIEIENSEKKTAENSNTTLPERYRILLKIFDTAGQKRFRTISEHYQSNNIDGVVLMVDITSALSYETAAQFITRSWELADAGEKLPILLVGNKIDLSSKRCIAREKFETLAREHRVPYIEISVKESKVDCENVFKMLSQDILKARERVPETIRVSIDRDQSPTDQGCSWKQLFLGFPFCSYTP